MSSESAFWSYVHADDEADGGRVTQLAKDLADQYAMITGESIDLFLDRDSLQWGDDWKAKVDAALASIAFFVAVISPRYFKSAECRRELQLFARQAEALGVRDLVLPLVYVDVPALHESAPADDSIALVKTFQWADWRELRLKDRMSEEYRTAVAALAQRLADANQAVTAASSATPSAPALPPSASVVGQVGPDVDGDDDEPPGTLDLMAIAEEAIPKWTVTVEEVGALIEDIGALAVEATAEMERGDAAGRGFATRLTSARKFARQLRPRADRVAELANDFTTHLYDVDGGIRAIVAAASDQAHDDETRRQVCQFFATIRLLAAGTREGMTGIRSMADSIAPLEALSRDMRPPLRTLRSGLTVMVEAQSVTDEWVRLIDAAPIICDEDEDEDEDAE